MDAGLVLYWVFYNTKKGLDALLGPFSERLFWPDAGWVWMDVRSTLGATEKVWGNCRAATLRRDDDGREE